MDISKAFEGAFNRKIGFGIFIMTMLPFFLPTYGESTTLSGLLAITTSAALGAYVFKRIPNRIFRYIVYTYIAVSGLIILLTN